MDGGPSCSLSPGRGDGAGLGRELPTAPLKGASQRAKDSVLHSPIVVWSLICVADAGGVQTHPTTHPTLIRN